MANNIYSIELGVHVKTSQIREQISKYNNNSNNAKIKLGVKLDTANLRKQIQSLNASGGTKGLLSIDTKTLEASLDRVANDIREIRTAFGTLDSKSKMGNLLTSINQISAALDKASKQFVKLNTQLNSLSGKSFGVNIGLNLGNGNAVSRNAAYGTMARGEVIPQLQQQVTALETYLARYYKVADGINGVQKLIQGTNLVTAANHPMTLLPQMADGSNLSKQMGALKQYIALIREAATVKGVDLTPVTSKFTQSADQLVTKAQNVQSGTAQMEESFKKLQGLFGSGINAEKLSVQLDSIVADLNEIRVALQGLSQNTSFNELTTSLNNLSASLERVVGNAAQAQKAINNGLNTSTSIAGTQKVVQEQNQLAQTTTQTANIVSKSAQKTQQAFAQMASASNLDPIKLKDDISETERFIATVTRLKQLMSSISKIQIGQVSTSKGAQELLVLENQLRSLSVEYNNTVAEINAMGGMGLPQMQQLRGQMESTSRTISQLKSRIVDTKESFARGIEIRLNEGEFSTKVQKVITDSNNLTSVTVDLRNKLNELQSAENAMNIAFKSGTVEQKIKSYKKYEIALKTAKNALTSLQIQTNEANKSEMLSSAKETAMQRLNGLFEKGSQAASVFGSRVEELRRKLDNVGNIKGVKKINAEIKNLGAEIKNSDLQTKTFGNKLKGQLSKYSTYLSGYMIFSYAIRGIRSMFEQVKAIDTAMIELKKVTDETDASYNQFLENAATRAREIGTTIDGIVSSTADFARLGYNFKDAQGLAEVANIYAVVGDEIEGVEQATESLISTMAAYKDEASGISNADFAMDIIDKFNEIGKLIA